MKPTILSKKCGDMATQTGIVQTDRISRLLGTLRMLTRDKNHCIPNHLFVLIPKRRVLLFGGARFKRHQLRILLHKTRVAYY